MNEDALAAVLAAANALLVRGAPESVDGRQRSPGARWRLAARVRTPDAGQARRFARAASRWTYSGRLP